jgi:hypothetical protein
MMKAAMGGGGSGYYPPMPANGGVGGLEDGGRRSMEAHEQSMPLNPNRGLF